MLYNVVRAYGVMTVPFLYSSDLFLIMQVPFRLIQFMSNRLKRTVPEFKSRATASYRVVLDMDCTTHGFKRAHDAM